MTPAPSFPVLCDLDGVIWLDHEPIPGSPEAVAALRRGGHRVLFVTNNSASLIAEHEAALERIGIVAQDDVVTSSQAAATLVEPGERVLIGGGPGVGEAVEQRGAEPVDVRGAPPDSSGSPVDAVIVGLRRDFDYRWLTVVSTAVRNGARFIATNADPTFPTPDGVVPGGGAMVAAVQTASGVAPTIAGKPNEAMARLVAHRLQRDPADLSDAVMIGDRFSTDGRFARILGARFAVVRSGVTSKSTPGDVGEEPSVDAAESGDVVETRSGVTADFDAPDLAHLVPLLLAERP